MSIATDFLSEGDFHPIDIVETLAEHHAWDFQRTGEDRITMAIEGLWRRYTLTLSWSAIEENLRLICSFEMAPPKERLPAIYEAINQVNTENWAGNFSYLTEEKMMIWRYSLMLDGGHMAGPEQIDRLVTEAVTSAERFYPAFQLVAWGDQTPQDALRAAIRETFGNA